MQVQGSPGHPVKYRGLADCFAVMARDEGLKSFYRGTISSYMKVGVLPALSSPKVCLIIVEQQKLDDYESFLQACITFHACNLKPPA